MLTRLACAVGAILLTVACAGPPRTINLSYSKSEVGDTQAAIDKKAIMDIPGVHNVTTDTGRDGVTRIQVFIYDGKEAAVMPKIDEMGYTRMR